MASNRALAIFAFRAVRKIRPTVPAAVYATLFSKQELNIHNAFQCYLVTYPLPPSLTPEPTLRE